jgi:hypothetical protein
MSAFRTISLGMLLGGVTLISSDIDAPTFKEYSVFNDNNVYIGRNHGLNDEYYKKITTRNTSLGSNVEVRNFLDRVETNEQNIHFTPSEIYDGLVSRLQTYITLKNNQKFVNMIDTTTNPLYLNHPLKEIIRVLNSINNADTPKIQKLEQSYDFLSQYLYPGKSTDHAATLDSLLSEKKGGDCNDLCASYYAFLDRYGFDVYLRIGKIRRVDDSVGLHVWLSVDIDGKIMDLDPTWYIGFVPLDNRNKYIKYVKIGDEITEKSI